jgi:hypothetical protein
LSMSASRCPKSGASSRVKKFNPLYGSSGHLQSEIGFSGSSSGLCSTVDVCWATAEFRLLTCVTRERSQSEAERASDTTAAARKRS